MIIVKNNIIPFKGFIAITIWPFIFTRKELNDIDRNHEEIHGVQQKELLLIFFYIIYIIEWFIRLFINKGNAYKNISFEKESYKHEKDLDYLKTRKHFAMWRND